MLLKRKLIIVTLFIPLFLTAGVHEYREHSSATYAEDCKILQTMFERDPKNLDLLEQIIKMQYAIEDFSAASQNCSLYLKQSKSKEIHYIYIMTLTLQSQYDRASQELSLYRSLYKVDAKEYKTLSDKMAIIKKNAEAQAYPSSKKTEWGTGKRILGIVPGSDIVLGYDTIDRRLFAYSAKEKGFTTVPSLPEKKDYSKALSISFSDDLSLVAASFQKGNYSEILVSRKEGSYYSRWQKPSSLNQGKRNASPVFAAGANLFMVSDRFTKNLDVCYATRSGDMSWDVKALDGVNTSYDEAAVSLSGDKKTLYFSSNGYAGVGGFDVYSGQLSYEGSRARVLSRANMNEMNSFRNGNVPHVASNGSVYFNHLVSNSNSVYEYSAQVSRPLPVETVQPVDVRPEVVARSLQFETGSAVILRVSYPYLNEVADYMQSVPTKKLVITGHTDNSGTDDINDRLSVERARSVAAYLTARGVNAERISVRGKGADAPVDTNDTEEGRARNRRVELEFTD